MFSIFVGFVLGAIVVVVGAQFNHLRGYGETHGCRSLYPEKPENS